MTEAPDTTLPLAFAAHLRSSHALLQAWLKRQPVEKQAQLGDFLNKGLRLGVSVNMPHDRYVIQVFLLNSAAGETVVLDTLEQSGPVPSVN